MKFFRLSLPLALALTGAALAQPTLTVHEWGTFTCLQDEKGRAIGRINSDDEPVPAFVHDIGHLIADTTPQSPPSKGLPPSLVAVNMRLETPVIYFHLPPGTTKMRADVEVGFRGGWLSQFYPKAEAETPGLQEIYSDKAPSSKTLGKLRWKGLTIEGHKSGPKCKDAVWNAPRQAKAESVRTGAGETEQFLFYRGVGHLDSPVTTKTDSTGRVEVSARLPLKHLWLADIRPGGASYAHVADVKTKNLDLPTSPSAPKLAQLKKEMKAALIEDGLYPDEAQAMLDAWQKSYFESPGLRIFFLVPQSWTDQVLPLTIKTEGPVKVKRVMIGRVELISREQRKILDASKRGDVSGIAKLGRFSHALLRDVGR